jgi:hypothetical protein
MGAASVTVYWWESGASLHRMPPGGTPGNLGGRSRYYIRGDEADRTGYDYAGNGWNLVGESLSCLRPL